MKFIAYDLGTGGVKASLYDESLNTLAKSFIEYCTIYPKSYMHEQRPEDWWDSVKESTRSLMIKSRTAPEEITCLALSGHSLVAVPIDRDRKSLMEYVPIWSDTRATEEAKEFFSKIDEKTWYMTTGNGFPAPCYSLFKLMWYKKHLSDIFQRTYKVLGSKDYINLKLTGCVCMDPSYASGTGAYDLVEGKMRKDFLEAAGISPDIFPEIVPPHRIVGHLTAKAAVEMGLGTNTLVACGGVDNACMALGAVGADEGSIYTSLGSSSWVPVNSKRPVLDPVKRPYVFAHIQENMFTSAFSIFAGGSSLRWAKETLCMDFKNAPQAYDEMCKIAATVPIGSNGIVFNPSLSGGTSQDKSINIRGAYLGLHLGTTRADMIRATLEGITLNLKMSISYLKTHTNVSDHILFCGGGSKSPFWMQMFADVFDMEIIKTNIDQDAASLGAAAISARAMGLWNDYSHIQSLHKVERRSLPIKENTERYSHLQTIFEHTSEVLADLGDYMMENMKQ